jgi:hypothetical protein
VIVIDVPGNPLPGVMLVIRGEPKTVKPSAEDAVCPLNVTDIFPEDAPAGTVTVSDSVVTDVIVAEIPLNFTILFAIVGLKLVPVIITTVPALPFVGAKLVIIGGGISLSFLHEFTVSEQITSNKTALKTNKIRTDNLETGFIGIVIKLYEKVNQ